MEEKIKKFMEVSRWEDAIQHLIDKGISPNELSLYTDAQFRAYLCDVMMHGKYKVAPPHIALVPKENGEFRKVYVNTVLDRLVLTIINDVYSELYADRIHPLCVSYQKGIGVKNIVNNITSSLKDKKSGYKVDISKYFDSVSKETMNNVLKSVDTGSCLDQILYNYYNDDLILDENDNLIHKYKSLCQGCAPSAFFANLTLYDVDKEISSMEGVDVYYRYSDDLLILGDGADKAMGRLVEILGTKGLSVNPKKVHPVNSKEWFSFLGCNIKGNRVTLAKKSLDNFVKKISDICKSPNNNRKISKKELKNRIKRINDYLYMIHIKNPAKFGWAEYFFSIINCEEDIITMDMWVKDMLRGLYTGKGGRKKCGGLGSSLTVGDKTVVRGKGRCVTTNLNKTDGLLEECGYVSMHHMWKVFKIGRDVYKAEVNRLM